MASSRGGFSLASVLLSVLMIAGGMAGAMMVFAELKIALSNEALFGAVIGGGAFVGGFFAARASHGETIAEPATGAVLVVGGLGALMLLTPMGKMVWSFAQDQVVRAAVVACAAALVGSLFGAFISEKLLGAATTWSLPWILYVALAVAGGCSLATIVVGALHVGSFEAHSVGEELATSREVQLTILIGIGGGCLLAGLAAGASARTRVIAAAFLGAIAGVMGFVVLAGRFSHSEMDQDAWVGAATLAIGGGVVAMIGTALGWVAIGRRSAS